MKPVVKFEKSIILLIIIVAIIAVTVFIVTKNTKTDDVTEMIENKKAFNWVFLVHDGDDLIFTEILFYDPSTSKGALLDIPGETGVIIEKLGKIDRIDKLYDERNPEDYVAGIEKMIEQDVNYYFQIDLDDFESLVDLLGGLKMFIDNPVEILEKDNVVLLPSGSIVLDGGKIQTYISYTDPEAPETEKNERYEKIIQALLEALAEDNELITSAEMYKYVKKTIDTDADSASTKAFIKEMTKLNASRLVFQKVLGVRRTVDEQELLFSHYDGNLLRETVRQTISSLANVDVVSSEELNMTIQILNGTNINGLASRTSQVFQSFGYDVAYIGNYDKNDIDKTVIVERQGDVAQAKRVASIIKCENIKTISPDDEQFDLFFNSSQDEEIDFAIVLGKDFDGRYCKE